MTAGVTWGTRRPTVTGQDGGGGDMPFRTVFPGAAVLAFVLYTAAAVYALVMLGRIAGTLSRIAAAVENMRVELAARRN